MRTKKSKKMIISKLALSALVLSSSLSTMHSLAATPRMYGDVNNDGKVDNMDLTMLCRYIVKDINLDEETLSILDLTDNLSIGVDDLALLKQYVMGDAVVKVGTYKEENPVLTEENSITLNGTSIVTTGKGTEVNGSIATIKEPGVYVITGTLNDGQIIVNVDKTLYPNGVVELSLEGATINCSNNSAIYVSSVGDECAITAKKDTLNTISDGTNYTNADGESGAIYSKDDLKIKGKGNLVVKGNCADGIVSKDSIKIFNGNIKVRTYEIIT